MRVLYNHGIYDGKTRNAAGQIEKAQQLPGFRFVNIIKGAHQRIHDIFGREQKFGRFRELPNGKRQQAVFDVKHAVYPSDRLTRQKGDRRFSSFAARNKQDDGYQAHSPNGDEDQTVYGQIAVLLRFRILSTIFPGVRVVQT